MLGNNRERSVITQGANLWVDAARSQGLRRIPPGELPTELRKRPSTNLAFEFLDQPFLLDLGVAASPPLVRAESKTLFQISADQARSETTIELQWVHGRLFETEFGVAAGLQLVSVGPADIVESSHLTSDIPVPDPGGLYQQARRLKLGLTPLGRGQNKVTIRLAGLQRIPPRRLDQARLVHSRSDDFGQRVLRLGHRSQSRSRARRRFRAAQTIWRPRVPISRHVQ